MDQKHTRNSRGNEQKSMTSSIQKDSRKKSISFFLEILRDEIVQPLP